MTDWSKADLTAEPFEWAPAESLDAVRTELRNAIFQTSFMACGHTIQAQPDEADKFRQLSCNFVAFGINSGLLAPGEGNEWLDGIWERNGKKIGQVALKYEKRQ